MDASSIDESTASDSTSISPVTPLLFHSSPSATAEAESRKLPSSRFKGVVPQPNGRWGAQIYEKHQRVWLGTFNEEHDAAKAYDIAALRFRGRDAVTNFKPLHHDDHAAVEADFLNSHSKLEIVDMLRKHTYNDELQQSKRQRGPTTADSASGTSPNYSGWDSKREVLFEKTVTPSDVGKLNRLVIPKQHAEKNFPMGEGVVLGKGMLLNFEDMGGKVWRFRYSYWNSSQSYVLTKGWSRFVKDNTLRAGDVVRFLRSTGPDKQLYIHANPTPGPAINPVHVVKLFGVNILQLPVGKTEGVFLELQPTKKQRIIKPL